MLASGPLESRLVSFVSRLVPAIAAVYHGVKRRVGCQSYGTLMMSPERSIHLSRVSSSRHEQDPTGLCIRAEVALVIVRWCRAALRLLLPRAPRADLTKPWHRDLAAMIFCCVALLCFAGRPPVCRRGRRGNQIANFSSAVLVNAKTLLASLRRDEGGGEKKNLRFGVGAPNQTKRPFPAS